MKGKYKEEIPEIMTTKLDMGILASMIYVKYPLLKQGSKQSIVMRYRKFTVAIIQFEYYQGKQIEKVFYCGPYFLP